MGHVDWVTQRIAALPAAVTLADGAEVPIGGVPHGSATIPIAAAAPGWRPGNCTSPAGRNSCRAASWTSCAPKPGGGCPRWCAPRQRRPGVIPARITIKDTTSRWGSCAPDGALAFSWRLVMAPEFVQDYVTAHEVAHLRHMNHGPAFWHLVAVADGAHAAGDGMAAQRGAETAARRIK